jgi:hypothetical protein
LREQIRQNAQGLAEQVGFLLNIYATSIFVNHPRVHAAKYLCPKSLGSARKLVIEKKNSICLIFIFCASETFEFLTFQKFALNKYMGLQESAVRKQLF